MESNLLSVKDRSFLEQAQSFFEDLQLGMSAFQIKHFVLNDESFPLPDSKYHQAKLELYTRWQKIVDFQFTFRKNLAQAKLLEAQRLRWEEGLNSEVAYERLEAEAQIELLEIEAEQLRTNRMFLQKSCAEALREMRVFMEVVEEMRTKLSYDSKEAAESEHWLTIQAIREQKPGISSDQLPFKRFLRKDNAAIKSR